MCPTGNAATAAPGPVAPGPVWPTWNATGADVPAGAADALWVGVNKWGRQAPPAARAGRFNVAGSFGRRALERNQGLRP